jgi:hypothetical protein
MRRQARMVMWMVLLAVLAACAGGEASASATSASPMATASVTSQPTGPADEAPAELQGAWTTPSGDPDPVTLTLSPSGYQVDRGLGFGHGAISVDGDPIRFFGSDLCDGQGTYTWSIEAGVLTFTPENDDPCDGRSAVLIDRTYERVP